MLLSQQSAYIEKCDSKIHGTAAWDFSPRSSLAPAFQTSTTKPWVKTSWAQKGWNRMEINWRVEVPWVLLIAQEPDGKFYFSEILLGLEYLHSQQVTLSMRSDDDTICIYLQVPHNFCMARLIWVGRLCKVLYRDLKPENCLLDDDAWHCGSAGVFRVLRSSVLGRLAMNHLFVTFVFEIGHQSITVMVSKAMHSR